jgi:uncharacterized protein with von Willebrand factor type A (vWA) domain
MFINFFYLLKHYGVPVSITEWMTLMEALSRGMAFSSLYGFYCLARAVLVKSETQYDRYDLAFHHCFKGIETSEELTERALKWLENALPPLRISPEERKLFQEWDLDELRRQLEERLKEQKGEHHGGGKWIGTGGTSPFGHSGYHPAGVRLGGQSVNKSAVKVAAERKFRGFRADETIGVRQFEVALRKLRQLSSKVEGPKDELDIDETIQSTADKGGILELVWSRARKNTVKLALIMDSGGSMDAHIRICSQLFSAVNKATHFKDLKFLYFHNCIYEHLFLDPSCSLRNSIKTEDFLRTVEPDYKIIIVGDASMAPSELTMVGGAIDWNVTNNEPGIVWLHRIASHFEHLVWLNPIPAEYWRWTLGAYTIAMIKEIIPMFELTLEGLDSAIKKLKVKK